MTLPTRGAGASTFDIESETLAVPPKGGASGIAAIISVRACRTGHPREPRRRATVRSQAADRGDEVRRAGRLEGLGTTIFTEMTALAERTGAINLGQCFPDTDGPAEIIEAATRALHSGQNQYAPLPGVPALREAVREHQRRYYGLDPEEVLVTFGATEAIAAALMALC